MSAHIEALTRGRVLPQAAVSRLHLMMVISRLREAWNRILTNSPEELCEPEASVSSLLTYEFNNLLEEDHLLGDIVKLAGPGVETANFDGSRLQKRPDLSIYWKIRGRHFPLVVECKIIDASTGKDVKKYTADGLMRFVDGRYAWACQEAMMLAFVRDASSIATALTPHLQLEAANRPERHPAIQLPVAVSGASDLATSQHGRNFSYPRRDPPNHQPGDITVWHLWV